MPDKSLLKIICMSSFITGAILGVFPLIPFFTGLAYALLMFAPAPFIIFYLYKLKLISDLDTPKCLIIGSISGFVAFLGFSCIYFPIALILYLIFKISSFLFIKVIMLNIGFLFFMVILSAFLSSMFNMFSAFLALCLFEYFKPKK